MLEVTLKWTIIPSRGVEILLTMEVTSCYRNKDKLGPAGPLMRLDFTFLRGTYLVQERKEIVKIVSEVYLVCYFRLKLIPVPYKDQCEKQMNVEKKKESKENQKRKRSVRVV